MADKVNLNPFSNSAFTIDQIDELDTNGDGIISSSEMYAKWTWLSQNSQDSEGALEVSTGYSGVTGQANTTVELKNAINTIVDEYLEAYYKSNPVLSDTERVSIQNILSGVVDEFFNDYLLSNPSGPYNLQIVSQILIEQFDDSVKVSQKAHSAVMASIDSYTNNVDENLSALLSLAFTADENNYVTDAEWNQIKNKAIQYLMGMMLSGEINTDLLIGLNSKYQTNSDYKAALSAITQLKTETNPSKMQQLLTVAQEKINSFLQYCGKDKSVDAFNDYANSKGEEAVNSVLDNYIDSYYEQIVTPDMTDEQKTALKSFVENAKNKYISHLAESGKINEVSEQDLINGFQEFLILQNQKLVDTQLALYNQTTEIDENFETLKTVSDKANANGNITQDERIAIIDAATNLIKSQLLAGNTQIAMLDKLGVSTSEMIALVSKMWSETDPDKLIEMKTQLEDMIKAALEKCSGEELVNAVNSMKSVEISELTKDKAVYNSSISSDYSAGASRSTSRGKQTEERLQEIQEMAKADLNAFAESLKAQLQSELGDAYNEADVQRYINDAINDTISLFTQNVYRKNQHGNYSTSSDNQAFVFARRNGTHKGRYVYNVKALIDTFVEKFNETSKIKSASKLDPSKATYDRENVIADSLGNDYDRNKSVKITGGKNDNAILAQLIEKAKEDLRKVAISVKQSLIAEGVPIDLSSVDSWLEDCINETIEDMKAAFQRCKANGKVSGGGIGSLAGGTALGTATAIWGTAAGASIGAAAAGTTTTAVASVTAGTAAIGSASLVGTEVGGMTVAMTGSTFATATGVAAAVPIVGWAVAGVTAILGVLGLTTNIFGAHWGQHNANAGFYCEEKSHSSKGRWGYDTQTLVNVFLAKVDAKVAEEKEKEKQKHNPETSVV